MDLEDRFWSKVKVGGPDECWEWVASRNRDGYGRCTAFGNPWEGAHRVSYRMHIGSIPNGMSVCHSCDNAACVNPTHLFLGPQRDNMRGAADRGRLLGKQAKIGLADAMEIRRRYGLRKKYARGSVMQKELAKEYGLTQQMIHRIISSKSW